jgi:hypothetical protein
VNLSIRHSAQTTRGCGFLFASHAHQLRQAIVSSHRCRRHLLIHIDLRAILRILHSVDLEAFVARFFPRISARCPFACCYVTELFRFPISHPTLPKEASMLSSNDSEPLQTLTCH